MTSKHTPGPWIVEPDGAVATRGGHLIATANEIDWPLDGGQEANARLIAAAPALLEALRELIDCPNSLYGHRWLSNPGGRGDYCQHCTALKPDNTKARTAIAQALGEGVTA